MVVAPLLHSYPNLKKPNPLAGAPPPILQSYPNIIKPNLVEVCCAPPSPLVESNKPLQITFGFPKPLNFSTP